MVRFERRLARSSQHTIGPVVLKLPERGLLGVVVITGGLGGLGLVTAEACVELKNTHLTTSFTEYGSAKYHGRY